MGETKEKIKKVIRFLAPKNNRVTREIADKTPYVVLGIALGAALLHSWVGQPAMIKGTVSTEIENPNLSIDNFEEKGELTLEDPVGFSGEIGSWAELKKHRGETLALKVIVVNAQTIETGRRGDENDNLFNK